MNDFFCFHLCHVKNGKESHYLTCLFFSCVLSHPLSKFLKYKKNDFLASHKLPLKCFWS